MKIYFLLGIFLVLVACGGSSVEPIDEQLPPETASLVFPLDNTECNEGSVINESQSSVLFQWEPAANTDSYEIVVEDLETQNRTTRETPNNEIDIIISRGKAYKWHVISKSNTVIETATSETWQFYNAGEGKIGYAPFPSDAVFPGMGSIVSGPNVTLEWSAADVDNDIASFDVYFDQSNPPTSLIGVTNNQSGNVDVVTGNTYYWYIKTFDEEGNTSNSSVFWFVVE